MRHPFAVLLAASLVAGCSSSPRSGAFDDTEPPAGGSSGATGGGSLGGGSTPTPGGNQDDCSEAAKLVYVVSDSNELYSFAPDKVTFTKIGTLDCPAGLATPNSMAIDRSGTAWVNFSDGGLFEVSTKDASCKATSYVKGQGGLTRFGMAFATNSASTSEETLYVVGIEGVGQGKGLAKIDLKTMHLTLLGDFSGNLEGKGAELTGTGDGRLFGFFTTAPNATLAQIDKDNGATTGDKDLAGVSTGNAWAFSFWGGDFWFYTSNGLNPSKVTRLKTSGDSSISTAKDNVGNFRIVGAGVSTCAPTTPPR